MLISHKFIGYKIKLIGHEKQFLTHFKKIHHHRKWKTSQLIPFIYEEIPTQIYYVLFKLDKNHLIRLFQINSFIKNVMMQ